MPILRLQDGLLRVVAASGRSAPALSREAWLRAVIDRHSSTYSRPEFLKAVRALSSRYVEDRARLGSRSPLDSAGKRAAFAGFYAPLHYLTTRAIVRSLRASPALSRIVDLGCGTGVAALACAEGLTPPPVITGVDQSAWALEEMRWNCQSLGLACRTHRASLVDALERVLAGKRRGGFSSTMFICAWSVNELGAVERPRALAALLAAHRGGASVLVIEPVASSAAPWWDSWRPLMAAAGGRADEWRFEPDLPLELAELDDAAGFRRDYLSARSFSLDHR